MNFEQPINSEDKKNFIHSEVLFRIKPFGKSIDNIDVFSNNEKIGYVQIVKNNKTKILMIGGIEIKEKGHGKIIYLKLQEQYPDYTIKSDVKSLSQDAINMWESLVRLNLAVKNGDKDYTLISKK